MRNPNRDGLIAAVTCTGLLALVAGKSLNQPPINPNFQTNQKIERVVVEAGRIVLANDPERIYADLACAPKNCKERVLEGFSIKNQASVDSRVDVNIRKADEKFDPTDTYALRASLSTCPSATTEECPKVSISIVKRTIADTEAITPQWTLEINDHERPDTQVGRYIDYSDSQGIEDALNIVRNAVLTTGTGQ